MDVKCGNGAFADKPEVAQALAQSIVSVANGAGLKTTVLVTDMNQVLGTEVGNALEMMEAIGYLKGEARDPRLHEVTMALGAELLVLGGLAGDAAAARTKLQAALDGGAAAERFARMVAMLGGPHDLLERPGTHLEASPIVRPVPAPRAGILRAMQTRELGMAVVELGGGRRQAADRIDSRVGLSRMRALGDTIGAGEALAHVHAADEASAARAVARVLAACDVGDADKPWQDAPVIMTKIK